MIEYLEKSAVIKAIHDEIYSGGNWSGGWYERSEEQAEKNFTERINAITPKKVIDISVIEYILAEIEVLFTDEEISVYARNRLNGLIDRKVNEVTDEQSISKRML